jgi:hypothetical protein
MAALKTFNQSTGQWDLISKGEAGDWSSPQFIRTFTSSHLLTSEDAGYLLIMDSSTSADLLVTPSLDLLPGQRIDVVRKGKGKVTFIANDVEIENHPNYSLSAQWAVATLLCIAPNVYTVYGDTREENHEDLLLASALVENAYTDVVTEIEEELYRVVTWRSSGSITPNTTLNVEYLIVAGGGGGGFGGGGAGGLLTNLGGQALAVNAPNSVVVGAGGVFNYLYNENYYLAAIGGRGFNSSFAGLTAFGGGVGSDKYSVIEVGEQKNGGSGGGGSLNLTGGLGIAGQGNAGASPTYPSSLNPKSIFGGGGGGSGSAATGADGGLGTVSSITGLPKHYAGGGGGGRYERGDINFAGTGFAGGGSGASGPTQPAQSGVNGSGSGGGGACIPFLFFDEPLSGTGGDGIVIIRWKI